MIVDIALTVAVIGLTGMATITRRRQNRLLTAIETMAAELDRTKNHVSYIHTRLRDSDAKVRWQ